MNKKKMKPSAFLRRYGRILVAGTLLMIIILIAIFAPQIATHNPMTTDMKNAKALPSAEHLMGTDVYGRDLFSRVIYGTRTSLGVTVSVNILAIFFGTLIGLIAGYFKRTDRIIMRIMEALNALPQILLSIVLVSTLGNGLDKLIIALAVVRLPGISRLVRSQVLSIKEKEHIESALAMGASSKRVMFKYILPLCSSSLIIRFTTGLGGVILSEAALSFLGVGMDPRMPSWGGIISEGKVAVMALPHLCLYPGIAIIITVLTFNILGDGIRDVLDPKLR